MSKAEFLSDRTDLTKKIAFVLDGNNSYAVVAYVGEGATEWLKNTNIRLVVNAQSAGTNPEELAKIIDKFGARHVKSISTLHAKVYVSDRGAIVCSANLSTNGLEIAGENIKGLIETGLYVPPSKKTEHLRIWQWCDEQFKVAEEIDREFLEHRIKMFGTYKKQISKINSRNGKMKATSHLVTLDNLLRNPKKYCIALYFPDAFTISANQQTADKTATIGELEKSYSLIQEDNLKPEQYSLYLKWVKQRQSENVTLLLVKCSDREGGTPLVPRTAQISLLSFHLPTSVVETSGRKRRVVYVSRFKPCKTISLPLQEKTSILSALQLIQELPDWRDWCKGKLDKYPMGSSYYLEGELFAKLYAKALDKLAS